MTLSQLVDLIVLNFKDVEYFVQEIATLLNHSTPQEFSYPDAEKLLQDSETQRKIVLDFRTQVEAAGQKN